MKSFIVSILILWRICCCAQPEPVDSRQKEIVFKGANVIPMDGERTLKNQIVIVRDGRIQTIGDAKKIKHAKTAMVIDARGKYLIPGLSEMHAHVQPIEDVQPMKETLLLFAMHGITNIRGMLGHPRHLELRSQLRNGEILGPRFVTSGPSLNGGSVRSAEDAQRMVREQKAAGYDFLKLHPGLTRENFDVMARTAKEADIPFAGHVSFKVGIWRAIEAGYATIDHLDGFIEGMIPGIENMNEQETGLFAMFVADRADLNQTPRLMNALRERQVWVVPTQALAERWFTPNSSAQDFRNDPEMKYMDSKTLDSWERAKSNLSANPKFDPLKINAYIKLRRKLILECNNAGVGLLLGSDAPQVFNVPGISTHQELQYLVKAGLSPYEALKTGTANAGLFYKRDDLGVIKTGAVADLILLNGNPLEDIANTQKIAGVMLGNNWLSGSYIERTLKQLEKSK